MLVLALLLNDQPLKLTILLLFYFSSKPSRYFPGLCFVPEHRVATTSIYYPMFYDKKKVIDKMSDPYTPTSYNCSNCKSRSFVACHIEASALRTLRAAHGGRSLRAARLLRVL